MKPREIFLSHSSRDLSFAAEVVETLRHHGLETWFSPKHIVGAQQWHDEIGRALNRYDWFLVILSPHAVRSQWGKRELQFALSSKRYEGRIVPLLLQNCRYQNLSWALPSIQTINFSNGQVRGFRLLLKIWKLNYSAAKTAPKG